MLVANTNTKRQRRPNVRLGEIGDASAAFACGFSQNIPENFANKRLKADFVFPKVTESHTRDPSELLELNLNPGLVSADLQHNRENNNPNDMKLGFELANLDEINVAKPKLDFAAITRQTRVVKKRRTPRGNNTRSAWFSNLSAEFSSEDGFKDLSDHETPGRSKNAGEYNYDAPIYDSWKLDDSDYGWKEDTCDEGNTNDVGFEGGDVNSVRLWLEEKGFSKYADLFEMHEVDEEALPLLTVEDLKEMGLFAVGTRRKLYSAIQRLNGKEVSV